MIPTRTISASTLLLTRNTWEEMASIQGRHSVSPVPYHNHHPIRRQRRPVRARLLLHQYQQAVARSIIRRSPATLVIAPTVTTPSASAATSRGLVIRCGQLTNSAHRRLLPAISLVVQCGVV